METFGHESQSLTLWLTGAGARSAEGTDMGHENAEGMAHVGVRLTAQLEGFLRRLQTIFPKKL